MVVQEEFRKGPWTEQEDLKLVYFVGLFGDRRWDFIAKVSGLCRTGKSCRLRWVNYLHPDLKRGKITPQEQRLIMELHSKWGNRWSRIARKLPGRTDNEIKNYWRTQMRKKKHASATTTTSSSSSPASSSCCQSSISLSSNNHAVDSHASKEAGEESFYDTGGPNMMIASTTGNNINNIHVGEDQQEGYYSMDDIWKDIAMSEDNNINLLQPIFNFSCPPIMPSPSWDDYSYSDPLWGMDELEEESKMLFPISDHQYFSCYDQQAGSAN